MTRKENNLELEEFKDLIDSRNLSSKEKQKEREAILNAREERFNKRSENERKVVRLLQLNYQMQEYVKDSACKSGPMFSKFLTSYVDILYEKRKLFAEDIQVSSILVSHLINGHREPNENFFYRLILHTQETFKPFCQFEKALWLKVFYQDKICGFSASLAKWGHEEKKNVKGKYIPF